MDELSFIGRIRRLIEEEAPFLIPKKTLDVDKLRPDSDEGNVAQIVDNQAVWAPVPNAYQEVYVQETEPEAPSYPAMWVELDSSGEPSGLWGNVV